MLLATLLALAMAPQRAATLDFDAKATAIGQLLQRLSAQTGANLKASPKIAREVVFVHAQGVDLRDLKVRLAKAMLAEWKIEGDTEYLARTPALDRQVWTAHVAYRRKLVDQALTEAQKQLEMKFDAKSLALALEALSAREEAADQATARKLYLAQEDLFSRGPLARLVNRLVLACNPNDLAAVGPYERRLFRIEPTRMQMAFDRKKYDAAMAAFDVEQQEWIDEAAKVNFSPHSNGRMVSDPRVQLNVASKLSGITLEIFRGESTALFFANLTSEDVKPFGYGVLSQTMFADPGRKFLNSQISPAAPAGDDPPVDLSEDSQEFVKRSVEVFGSRQVSPISRRMKDLMRGIERNDPLSWTVSDGLSAIARMKKVNLVAAVPDTAFGWAYFISRQNQFHAKQFLDTLVDTGTMEMTEGGGWAVMSPPDRYEAATDFTPRAATVALIKSVLDGGSLDIHDYARFAFDSKRLNRGGLGEWFLPMIDRSVLGTSDHTDWKTLQLFGALNTRQQHELETGGRILYGGMTAEQAAIVDRIIYAHRLTGGTVTSNGTSQSFVNAVEPTDAYPERVPSNCAVTATVRNNNVIVAYGKGSDGRPRRLRGVDPATIAFVETDVVADPLKMSEYGLANFMGYAPGVDKTLIIKVETAPNIWASSTIVVPDYDANATPVQWDKLPDPYPRQIAAALAQLKAQKASQPTRAIPPK